MSHMAPVSTGVVFRPSSPAEILSIDRLHQTWAGELYASRRSESEPPGGTFPPGLRRPLSLISPESPAHRCIVAESRTQIVGMIATLAVTEPVTPCTSAFADKTLAAILKMTPENSLHICGLAVLLRHRRRGIAGRLLSVAEIEARVLELPKLSVTLFETATPALRFFLSVGFGIVRRCCAANATAPEGCSDIVVLEKPVTG